jgi:magnesium chelatase accessory protein
VCAKSESLDFARDGADWPNREASRFVEAGGLNWHVQVMGQGPDLLLLHGTGGATHSWRDLAPLLAQHFRVVAPDLPGHGFTMARRAPDLSLPGMAASIAALIGRLGLKPEVVVGHSAGAAILARLCLDSAI